MKKKRWIGLVVLLVIWLVGVMLQTLGNPLLKQAGLQLRPWANTALSIWSGAGLVLVIGGFLGKEIDTHKDFSKEEVCGLLIIVGFLAIAVFFGTICIGMGSKREWVGMWNGQQVIIVTDGFSGFSYYQYHDSVLMGEYLGNSFDD